MLQRSSGRLITSLVAGHGGGGHEGGKALALALEGGHPASGAERLAGAEQRAIQMMHLAFVVLRVFHPGDLPIQSNDDTTIWSNR
ncbi:hypothetical protein BHE74_00030612 [Ensete ventricosum]|nr:hypothetical protein GW17_00056835 [Ensete ventricosum]RWW62269.1 hypothetical protein BHE74_00030612 [Ensete ventricosum]RZS18572.1 hypothetical protein BHM03_00050864 [Ensete ventricosum]